MVETGGRREAAESLANPHHVSQILDSQILEVGKVKSELQHVEELAGGGTECECRQGGIEVRELCVVDQIPRGDFV